MPELAKGSTRSISAMLIEYDEATLSVTVSVGYALHNRAKSVNFDDLTKAADNLLLVTKKSGKNNYLADNAGDLTGNYFSNSVANGNACR